MTRGYALGIDVGTSGVRVALLTPKGELAGLASASMAEHGTDHRDPAVWRATLEAALVELRADHDLNSVGAVSVDGTSGTVLALDTAGQPVGMALMYNDAVSDPAIPAAIAEAVPRESAAHGPASALARAIALQDRPGVTRILHQADWIAAQLSGDLLPSDESNALKTGYDPMARAWPDWLEKTPIRRDVLPQVQPVGTQTGATNGRFGLPKGAVIVAGVTDGCASFLATGASEPGDGVSALGTTLTVKLLSDKPIFAPEYGIYSHRIGDMWLAGGASNTGGGVLAAHFSPHQITTLSDQITPEVPTGLDYYPLLRPGERFPINDPELPPRLTPRPDSDVQFLQAMFEAMARIEAEGYRRLQELGAPALTRLRTVGGGAKNAAWRRIRLADLAVPEGPALSDQAAVGVARLALQALPQ